MKIQNISKNKKEVLVELSADELTIICNALYSQSEETKGDNNFLQLRSDMMIIRDLCQYGHIDNFCLKKVLECRNKIKNKED